MMGLIQPLRRQPAATLTLCLFIAAADLTAFAHAALVPHVVCAEHGDVTHARAGQSPIAPPERGPVLYAHRAAPSETHGHCDGGAVFFDSAETPHTTGILVDPGVAPAAVPLETPAHSSLAILRLAANRAPPAPLS